MQRIKLVYTQFLREPLWFKIFISSALAATVIFSSSFFPEDSYYQVIAKLAAAVFFITYGLKFRRNTQTSVIFFAVAALCLYLSWHHFSLI
ncbi:hypothetical protein C2I18_14755 [Paenibacillus sp. PK3_47]|uniref:hypothetical protein n=1 Tax=Paenibacillus sp. PK3_47 TaxID=2072642 RepID=UPI00201E49C4|nr:hypothetical protein [Paenibacillus sp. PK3_47]UQZ34673.1 hypothetical protein C2I18_14755 [Paenibacillus sp. PK3_47]